MEPEKKETNELDNQDDEVTEEEDTSTEEDSSKETPSADDSSEEEESSEEKPATPKEESTEDLIEGVKEEVGEKRFDGLMAAWQRDRRDLQKLQNQPPQAPSQETTPPAQSQDKAFGDYVYKEVKTREGVERMASDEAARKELEEATKIYPKIPQTSLLDTALKYRVNLTTAGQIIQDQAAGSKATQTVAEQDQSRKSKAGKVGGKSATDKSKGISKYDPKLSMEENIDVGRKELGM
ncbi:MAG TPA: hypothetical protein ENI13_01670 [candidate division CPR3 bacterium]|uniref:Uncharacterized protein n=1 Tax=candidate division CPR3 bacterium TaxID=2268181 RepID=A0A7C1NPR8_UNCC3|nr:hypothetical protein [candidate division CPR3 bacterium]